MDQDIVCTVCQNGSNEAHLLLCDGCDRGFHTFCLNLRHVPHGSWYCPRCTVSSSSSTSTTEVKKAKVDEPKQVHVYIRVSTKGQNDPEYGNAGMDTQNVEVLQFCMANNLYVKSCTTEIGSAYHTRTPKLDKLIEKLRPDVPIMVYSANRFSRNVAYAQEKIAAIHAKGGFVWSVTDKITSKDAGFMALIQAAENDSREKGARISAAHRRIRAQGGFVGKKPFGYNKVRVDGVFKLQENRIEQAICKKIRELAKVHQPSKLLAVALKKWPRYQWTPSMITSIIYDGVRRNHAVIAAESSGMDEMADAIDEVEDEVVDNSNVYIVKRLHKIHVNRGVYEILVEWKGCSKCSWENVVSLHEDVPEMVEEFLEHSTSALVPAARALIAAPVAPPPAAAAATTTTSSGRWELNRQTGRWVRVAMDVDEDEDELIE